VVLKKNLAEKDRRSGKKRQLHSKGRGTKGAVVGTEKELKLLPKKQK